MHSRNQLSAQLVSSHERTFVYSGEFTITSLDIPVRRLLDANPGPIFSVVTIKRHSASLVIRNSFKTKHTPRCDASPRDLPFHLAALLLTQEHNDITTNNLYQYTFKNGFQLRPRRR